MSLFKRENTADKQALDAALKDLDRVRETLLLLMKLEPALREKYTTCPYPEGTNGYEWGLVEWDNEGMKAALEFKRQQELAEKYIGSPKVAKEQ